MKIDYKNEVLKRKDDILKDLQELIKIPSELTTFDPNRENMPFGEGPKQALDYMLGLGIRDGFITNEYDGYAGDIQYGDQAELIAMLGHLDVVPAGNDWINPPYEGVIIDGIMYGRGTEDDKGPTIAAYYALKILKDLKIPLSKRIKLILGTDEESGSRCIQYYLTKDSEVPVAGFVPDADFPLIYAEKGIANIIIEGDIKDRKIYQIKSGFRPNMVPDFANLIMQNDYLEEAYSFESEDFEYSYNDVPNFMQTNFKFVGKSAHGSTPELGKNAVFEMVQFLKHARVKNQLVELLDDLFVDDTRGVKLGINHHDKEMGDLIVNLGVLELIDNHYKIVLNLRLPKGVNFLVVKNKIAAKIEKYKAYISNATISELLYVDPNSELVTTLMDVYRRQTGDLKAKPVTIGGGTFARTMPNLVAFGPHFPGKVSKIHQPDEFIEIEDLLNATAIYLEALYELAK